MFKTLRSKFIFSFMVANIIFLLIIAAINLSSLKRTSASLTDEKIEASSQLFGHLIRTPLITYDLATLDDAIKNFALVKNIVAIQIEDRTHRPLSVYEKIASLSFSFFRQHKEHHHKEIFHEGRYYRFESIQIIAAGEPLGHAHFIFDITESVERIQNNQDVTYLIVILAIFVSFIVSYVLGNRLGRSLNRLSDIAYNVAQDKRVQIPYIEESQDEMGKLYYAMHTMQEHIKERTLRLQHSLNEQQQFVHALDQSAIVSKTDSSGNITYVNEQFCQISGYTSEELIGVSHNIVRHPDNPDLFFKQMWDTIKSKQIFKATFKNRAKNGTTYYVDATIVPLLDHSGEISEYLAIRYEVTDLVLARDKAQAAEKSKGEFLSNMSHEIRTPLNAILGFVQILQKSITGDKELSYLDIIANSSQTLLQIINEILDLSKIESGKLLIDDHPFDPVSELSQTSRLFTINAKEKSIRYLAFIDPQMPAMLLGDLTRIKQILFNFLSNAFKFTPEGKSVTLRIDYDPDVGHLNLEVKDEGIGIAPEMQEKIFHAFEQADTSTTRKFGGTGLGLTISAKLAALMQGSITLASEVDRGSTFRLSVPLPVYEGTQHQLVDPAIREYTFVFDPLDSDHEAVALIQSYLDALQIRYTKHPLNESLAPKSIALFTQDGPAQEDVISLNSLAVALMPYESECFNRYPFIVPLIAPYTLLGLCEVFRELTQKGHSRASGQEALSHPHYQGRLLVAEDNPTNQMLIEILLNEYDIRFDMANDGLEALSMYQNGSYDLILMDENMPNMTGLEAFKEIRAYEEQKALPAVPVVALTANVMEEDRIRFTEAGMSDFLAKPLDTDELERVLARFLTPSS